MAGGVLAELFATLGLESDEASFEKGEKLVEGVKTALEALAVYEGVKVLHEWVDQTVEAGVGFERLGEKLGVSAESVQQLGYAADVSGASVEDMQVGLQHLAMQMEEVKKTGTGPLADGLVKLKIPFSNLKGEKLDQNLEEIADAFSKLPPTANKTGIAMELFGRSGTALIPLLNRGADGIRELREEFEATGAEISTESIESLEKYEETQKRLSYIVKGFKNEAVMALVPELQKLADGLQAWIKNNRELIKQRIEQVVKAVVVVLRAVVRVVDIAIKAFGILAEIVDKVAEAFGALVGGAGGIEDVLVDAAIAVGAAWEIANAPLILMAAIVAALILVVQDLWSWINGGDSVLKNLYHAFVQWLGESGAGRVVLGLIAGMKGVIEFIENQVERLINLGHRIGSWAAFIKLRNQHYNEIVERNEIDPITGKALTPEQIQKKAEEEADYDIKQHEAQELADKRAAAGINSRTGAPVQNQSTAPIAVPQELSLEAPSIAAPVVTAPGAAGPQSFATTFAPNITVNGGGGSPREVADAVHSTVLDIWHDHVNQAANDLGVTGGSNLP